MRSINHVRLMKKVLIYKLDELNFRKQPGNVDQQKSKKLKKWISELNHIEKFGSILDPESPISIWYEDFFTSPLDEYDTMLAEFNEYEEILKLTGFA